MGTCGGCGAPLRDGVAWCVQCYLPVGATVRPDLVAAVAAAPPPPAPPSALPPPFGPPAAVVPAPVPVPFQRPAPPPYDAVPASGSGNVAERVWLTVGAILVGVVGLVVMEVVSHSGHTENSRLIRISLGTTALVYALVCAAVLRYVSVSRARLRWHDGDPVTGAAVGALTGLVLAGVMLALVAAVTGKASGDPRIGILVSEGGLDHILTAILIAVVAAPLVEETLFRGVLAESLRPKGKAPAILVSAVAFSAWHLQPGALRYYFAMGALLAGLYWKRGLVCSMSAHAAFNGVLTLAAITSVANPGPSVSVGPLVVHAPAGWTRPVDSVEPVVLQGPAAATVTVMHQPTPAPPTAAELLDRVDAMAERMPAGVQLRTGTARIEHLPVGDAVRVALVADGHAGVLVVLPVDGELFELILGTEGSSRAERDFDRMLRDISG